MTSETSIFSTVLNKDNALCIINDSPLEVFNILTEIRATGYDKKITFHYGVWEALLHYSNRHEAYQPNPEIIAIDFVMPEFNAIDFLETLETIKSDKQPQPKIIVYNCNKSPKVISKLADFPQVIHITQKVFSIKVLQKLIL